MKPRYLAIVLLFSPFISCKNSKSKPDEEKLSANDTIATINLLKDIVTQQLNAGRSSFDTTLIVE
jgi:hypothetical protein